jgi:hypothetical protein
MNKFIFWSLFGLAINMLALLRGIALISDLSPISSSLGIATAVISLIGLYASFLIVRKNATGIDLAKKQVWGIAIAESLTFITTGDATSSTGKLSVIAGFIFASQLSRLFASQQAQDYCICK